MMPPSVGQVSDGDAARDTEFPALALKRAVRQSFLGQAREEVVNRVAAAAAFATEEPRAVLFRAGEVPATLHLVLEGSVSLFGLAAEDREVTLDLVQPIDMVAPWAMLDDSPLSVSARVVRRARLLCLPARVLRRELERDDGLARALLPEICRRARALVAQIEDLKVRTTTERVGRYLLSLAAVDSFPADVELPFSKQLIASQLGMTPESLSRAFAALRSVGVVIAGNHVSIDDPARLRRFCQPSA